MQGRRKIVGNSVEDMQRYGWVVFEYSLLRGEWIGRDLQGNKWVIGTKEIEGVEWAYIECNDRWYRCVKPETLESAGAQRLPLQPVHDARNG